MKRKCNKLEYVLVITSYRIENETSIKCIWTEGLKQLNMRVIRFTKEPKPKKHTLLFNLKSKQTKN